MPRPAILGLLVFVVAPVLREKSVLCVFVAESGRNVESSGKPLFDESSTIRRAVKN